MQKLSELPAEPYDINKASKSLDGNSTDGGSKYGDNKCEPEV